MPAVAINIVNTSAHPLPSYATPGAAGMDLRANLNMPITLQPMERYLVPTGLFIALPEGFEAQVRPRSGLAIQKGLTCLNTPGTVDSDYRGEIKIILVNLGNTPQEINDGDRIAQLVIGKVERAELNLVQQLNETGRSTGGFGHTGTQ